MKLHECSSRAVLVAVVVAWLGSSAWPSGAQAMSFGGQSTGVQATVPAAGVVIKAASGQLPPSGGEVDASLLSGDIPGSATGGAVALSAGTLHSVVVGLDETDAEASLANVSLTISGNGITTDFMMARSNASCGPGPAVTGSSELANLVINGQAITVTGNPNQTVALPNGTVIINQQLPSLSGTSGELSVMALHVTTIDTITHQVLADVMLAIADAQIDCQAGSGPAGKATTGGGWITVTPGGGKGTFGVVGAIRQDATFSGHLVYINHDTDFRVQSTSIESVTPSCQGSVPQSQIVGSGNSNFGPVGFTVTVTDAGEPGSSDTFTIEVSGAVGDFQSGTLGGGNIQVRRQTCP